jgi:hypothetical protein
MRIYIRKQKDLQNLFDYASMEAVRSVLSHLGYGRIGMMHTTKDAMLKEFNEIQGKFKPFTILTDEFFCNGVTEYKPLPPRIVEVEKIVQVEAPAPNYSKFQKFIVRLFKL